MMEERRSHRLLRLSLAFVWLSTAAASIWERDGQSLELLKAAGMTDSLREAQLIWSGVAVDAIMGLALIIKPVRATYFAALAIMICMTLLATLMLPALWLHPLGPLTKNIPIAVILWLLATEQR